MTIKFLNTLTRKKETFKPLHKGEVKMYVCGPTVYDMPHIGNYRSFVTADLIRRYLEFRGFKVKQVMNITDIDDKTIRDSGKVGMMLKDFTEKYTKIFFGGIDVLNIKHASIYAKATEHVKEMERIVKVLVERGYAYVATDGVYFDISKFKRYGRLSKINLKGIKAGARVNVDEYAKDSPQDFALMKRSTTEELKRNIYYETGWGKVRPGWHIECSALSMKYLGETVDIHTGGVDLIFPHHENEIAQSEAYTGKQFVKYWIHGEHLLVNGTKMSKSLGNIITLDDVVRKIGPESVRYMYVSVHYKKKLNYTDKFAENAKNNYERLKETFEKLNFAIGHAVNKKSNTDKKFLKKMKDVRRNFIKAMDDNLNTPLALKALRSLSKEANIYMSKGGNKKVLEKALELFKELSGVLGLQFKRGEELPEEVKKLIEKREEARKKGDFTTADNIRHMIREMGYIIEDTEKGTRWKKVK